jgi:PAS domain S-box-containing protein
MSATPQNNLTSAFKPAREALLIWVALTACAVMGVWMGGQYGERKLAESISKEAINSARAAMLGLDPQLHQQVALQEKMWSDAHKRALATLVAFHKQYPDVSRVRTFMLDRSGNPVVILDSETVAGQLDMKRPVNPAPLRTELAPNDPAYAVIKNVLKTREAQASETSNYDGYRFWRPGVVPLGTDAAIEADLTSHAQENTLQNLRMWVGTGMGIAVIACGIVALIYFSIRSSHLVAESTGSEAKRGQEWLEQRNGRLVEALGQLVLHRDLDAGCLLWDGDAKLLIGTPVERMPMDFEGWLERIHPTDVNRVRTAARKATHDNRTYELEYRIRHEGGEWKWFREHGVVSFISDDQRFLPTTVDCVLEDISDLKSEQEELAALALIASRTDNAVCLTDADGRVQWTNTTFQRLTGFEAFEAHKQALIDLFADSPDAAALAVLIKEAVAGNGRRAEVHLTRRDGSTYWTNIELQPLKDDAGHIARLVAIQSDITAAKEFEARLVNAKEAAETADRAKSEFLAVMSHEIRTPLNGVLGFTRLLLDTQLTAQQRDYIDTIRSSGDSLLHLLNDILDFSKMDASSMQLDHAPFDLRSCIEDALDVLIAPAMMHEIELVADIALDAPPAVVGDRARLRQILLNLAGNAVKFTEKGEVSVAVRLMPATPNEENTTLPVGTHVSRLRFEVRDTGPGIDEEQQAKLFKPFTQADSSATRKHGGTGLGLAISKRLVLLMGGEIGLKSMPGQGSTFWFEIPMAVADHQPPPPPALQALKELRVLLVEKNATVRRGLSAQLSAWGMQVEAFARGRDSILAAEHRRFDVALLDVALPDMDGLSLVDRLRNSPRRNVGGIIIMGLPGRLPVPSQGPFDALHRLIKPIHIAALAETLLRAAPRIARVLAPPIRRTAPVFPTLGAKATEPAPAQAATAIDDPANPPRRILVADDNAINRKLVKKMLDGMGFASVLVTNGAECVEAVKAHGGFEAILMDIQMPELDGLGATQAIRQLGSAIPIIALTADAMPDDRARCLAAGMNDYLQKPVRPDALGAALDRASATAET